MGLVWVRYYNFYPLISKIYYTAKKSRKEIAMGRVENLRKLYPNGTRIVLRYMQGEPQMPSGLKGTVQYIDDIGQIHVDWDNGSSLAINITCDSFELAD